MSRANGVLGGVPLLNLAPEGNVFLHSPPTTDRGDEVGYRMERLIRKLHMDSQAATKLSEKLIGKQLSGWRIEQFINHGKSAAVFLASREGEKAAVKIFDPDLVQRFGKAIQLERIEREKSLAGKNHPNLVRTFDGGECDGYLFIAMEYFNGKNLAEVLESVPPEHIRPLIHQVAAAAQFLEESSFAHRDIKPENIGISPDLKSAKLLDLGVLRPLDLSSITDQGDQRQFIGTLQYSPPELLFREENQSQESWRAITFYQLGGVLHDLLMRRPLFGEFATPYARMVRAVQQEVPKIDTTAEPDLRLLAQNCLAKDPQHRLNSVKWEYFDLHPPSDPMEAARKRIAQRRAAATSMSTSVPAATSDEDLVRAQRYFLRSAIESAVVNLTKTESLPRYEISIVDDPFTFRIVFKPSPVAGLTTTFAFLCSAEVLDARASLSRLSIQACIANNPTTVPGGFSFEAPFKEVRAALIDQDIRAYIQPALLTAFAVAPDLIIEAGQEICWMDLGSVS